MSSISLALRFSAANDQVLLAIGDDDRAPDDEFALLTFAQDAVRGVDQVRRHRCTATDEQAQARYSSAQLLGALHQFLQSS
jgi:hypothetical protein